MPEEACPTYKQVKPINVKKEGNVEIKEFSYGHRHFIVMLRARASP